MISSWAFLSLCSRWILEVARKTWMRALFSGGLDRLAGGIDILGHATGEAGDDGALDFPGDCLNGGEVAFADDGEAGFNDIDFEAGELAGDLELFPQVHRGARALLAIAERGVKDDDSIVFHRLSFGCRLAVDYCVYASRPSLRNLAREMKRKTPLPGSAVGLGN